MDWNNPLVYMVLGFAAISGILYLARWMGRTDASINAIKKAIDEIQTDISTLRAEIDRTLGRLPDNAIFRESPLRLGGLGKSISHALNAAAWAKETASDIAPKITGKHPYEVQEFCKHYIRNEFNPPHDFMQKMMDCAYNDSISLEEVKKVLVIELRDALLTIFSD